MARAEARALQIEVVYCPEPRRCERVSLQLNEGACLQDALQASGLCQRHGLDAATLRAGIWGRVQPANTPLREQDRIEIYRPLKVDPKEARRLRYKRQRR
jgi:uncharacterized protein